MIVCKFIRASLLYIGVTLADFISEGKIPVENDKLQICVSRAAIYICNAINICNAKRLAQDRAGWKNAVEELSMRTNVSPRH